MIECLPDLNFVRAGMTNGTIVRSNGEAGHDNPPFSIFRTPFSFPIN